jgi:hypothetical protein
MYGLCLCLLIGLTAMSLSPQMNRPTAKRTKSIVQTESIPPFSVLLFSKTAGFRHASIPTGIATITTLGQSHNFNVLATEDAALFTDDQLAVYQVVIFLNTTGDILNEAQQGAFERFIQKGGGFVGIHSATDTEYDCLGTANLLAPISPIIQLFKARPYKCWTPPILLCSHCPNAGRAWTNGTISKLCQHRQSLF